jgi:hypothetical protein
MGQQEKNLKQEITQPNLQQFQQNLVGETLVCVLTVDLRPQRIQSH